MKLKWSLALSLFLVVFNRHSASSLSLINTTVPIVISSNFSEEGGASETDEGVRIIYRNQSLRKILEEISNQTGMEFILAGNIPDSSISVNIHSRDWRSAINELLGNQSRLEFWTGDPSTSKFWLMEGEMYDVESFKKLKQKKTATVEADQKIGAARNIAPKSVSQKTMSILPPHILFDPGLLLYLKSVGIQLPIEFQMQFEPVLEGLPEDHPISQMVLKDPLFKQFIEYLDSVGIEPPKNYNMENN